MSSRGSGQSNRTLTERLSSVISRTPRPLWYVLGFVTSSYFLTTVLIAKISDVHSRITSASNSKDGLKKGFKQNQEDAGFTIMALLPMLGKGMDAVFDVEGVTEELKAAVTRAAAPPPAEQAQSLDGVAEPKPDAIQQGATLTNGNTHHSGLNGEHHEEGPKVASEVQAEEQTGSEGQPEASCDMQNTGQGFAENQRPDHTPQGQAEVTKLDAQKQQEGPPAQAQALDEAQSQPPAQESGANGRAPLSPTDESAHETTNGDATNVAEAAARQAEQEADALRLQQEDAARQEAARIQQEEAERARRAALAADRKRKAQLWNDLKVISLSRYLTSLYAVNLISLLTNVQLSLLGRYSYLRTLSGNDTEDHPQSDPLEDAWARSAAPTANTSSHSNTSAMTQRTEEEYLTFSWYFLHIGWKNLATRVQTKVEETVGSMPLKTQLSHADLLVLLRRIRRRIEYEYEQDTAGEMDTHSAGPPPPAFMGAESLAADLPAIPGISSPTSELSSSMLSTASTTNSKRRQRRRKRFNLLQYLLPSTPEGDLQVLESAGIESSHTLLQPGSALSSLLDETRDLLESKDAQGVLRECLTHSFDESFAALGPAFGLSAEELDHLAGSGSVDGIERAASATTQRIRELRDAREEEEIRSHPTSHGQRLKLAAVLPFVAGEADLVLQGVPNSIVESIATVKDLKAFSAIIYSSWTSGVDG